MRFRRNRPKSGLQIRRGGGHEISEGFSPEGEKGKNLQTIERGIDAASRDKGSGLSTAEHKEARSAGAMVGESRRCGEAKGEPAHGTQTKGGSLKPDQHAPKGSDALINAFGH